MNSLTADQCRRVDISKLRIGPGYLSTSKVCATEQTNHVAVAVGSALELWTLNRNRNDDEKVDSFDTCKLERHVLADNNGNELVDVLVRNQCVYAVDSCGQIVLGKMHENNNKTESSSSFSVSSASSKEFGPHNLCSLGTDIVRSCHFGRQLSVFSDGDCSTAKRTFYASESIGHIAPMLFDSSSSVFYSVERRSLSCYDVRAERARVQRIVACSHPAATLRVVATHERTSLIAVAGSDRSVTLVDVRKWRGIESRANLTKYDIGRLHLAPDSERSGRLMTLGIDSELCTGRYETLGSRTRSIDSRLHAGGRWLGSSMRSDGLFVGLTDAALYVVDDAVHTLRTAASKDRDAEVDPECEQQKRKRRQ
jgi:hypothetical protein